LFVIKPSSLGFAEQSELQVALFWLLAGVLSACAALIVLLPWLRAIPILGPLPAVSRRVLAGALIALAAVVGLYELFGRPDLITRPAGTTGSSARAVAPVLGRSAAGAGAATNGAGSMSSAIANLEARLAKGGGTTDDWELLAKSYEFMNRPADAAKARARELPAPLQGSADAAESGTTVLGFAAVASAAPALTAQSLQRLAQADADRREKKLAAAAAIYAALAAGDQLNADGWADYADTAASLRGNKLAGEPETFVARALALDPQHPKALWLKASADEEAGRWSEAVIAWQKLQAVLDPQSADARIVAANLQQDLRLAGGATAAAAPAAVATAVSGEVMIADELRARALNATALFIVAKSVDSAGAPVAVLRTAASGWPVKFTLDDSQAMLPGRNLSSAGRVKIEARISRSGQATPTSGDLRGSSEVIDPSAARPLRILIDQVIP